jgi:hypothetical protein
LIIILTISCIIFFNINSSAISDYSRTQEACYMNIILMVLLRLVLEEKGLACRIMKWFENGTV